MGIEVMTDIRLRSWAMTHPGAKRKHNEDACVDRPGLGVWAVADGAGGHDSGAVASTMICDALEALPQHLSAADLLAQVRKQLEDTHTALRALARERGPQVTIASTVVVLLARDEHFACLWAGDSRAYLLRGGTLEQISKDHSLVQELVDSGAISPEEAEGHPRANVITRAIGADQAVVVLDKVSDKLLPGDRFLLCSDGLCKTLPDPEIADLLRADDGIAPPERLIAAALARGAADNVTAVVVQAD